MKKEWRNYLHLYIGSDFRYRYVDYKKDEWAIGPKLTPTRYSRVMEDASVAEVQLILRSLSDMTEEEMIEVLQLTIPYHIEDKPSAHDYDLETFKHDGGNFVDEDVAIGCNYSCICFDGQMAIRTCGSVHFFDENGEAMNGYNSPQIYAYLLSRSFDLFGLIESSLAISKPTLQKG